jgi:hypothetical protein
MTFTFFLCHAIVTFSHRDSAAYFVAVEALGEMVGWPKRVAQHTWRYLRTWSWTSYASEHIQLIASNVVSVYSERMIRRITTRLYISLQKTASFWLPIVLSWSNVLTRRLPKTPQFSDSHSELKCPELPLEGGSVPTVPKLEVDV